MLGDEALAAEIMETAIEQAVAYLTDHPPKSQEDVNAALLRFSRQVSGVDRERANDSPSSISLVLMKHQILIWLIPL